jgi:hypothetical protein
MEKLAEAILLAAKLREESYDHKSAQRTLFKNLTRYSQFYKISIKEAADQAAENVGFDKRGTQPIYLLLQFCWNDALDWAENFTKGD